MRILVVPLIILCLAPLAIGSSDVIQPGDRMTIAGETQCTLSFVFDGAGADAGRMFISIASHCVTAVGQTIDTDNFSAFGAVILKGDASATATDIAIIEVAPALGDHVVGELRGHPGFPTGVANEGTTAFADRIVMSGWGTGFGERAETREGRVGLLLRHDATILRLEGPVTPGDSGGPWTMSDGRAVAIVSKIQATFSCCDPIDGSAHQEGPTVQNILATAAAAGIEMTLRTA